VCDSWGVESGVRLLFSVFISGIGGGAVINSSLVDCDIGALLACGIEVAGKLGARVRCVLVVSRRRFGPSLTLGWVWHYKFMLVMPMQTCCGVFVPYMHV